MLGALSAKDLEAQHGNHSYVEKNRFRFLIKPASQSHHMPHSFLGAFNFLAKALLRIRFFTLMRIRLCGSRLFTFMRILIKPFTSLRIQLFTLMRIRIKPFTSLWIRLFTLMQVQVKPFILLGIQVRIPEKDADTDP
jgi:hypothetical protein